MKTSFLFLVPLMLWPALALGQPQGPAGTDDAGITQRLDEQTPLNLDFFDENGKLVRLREYFDDRPVILVLAYYRCPRLCNRVLNGLAQALKQLKDLSAGTDFQVVVVSFDPTEQPELAKAKKEAYIEEYGRPGGEKGWHFLTGRQSSIRPLARAVGFRYAWNPQGQEYKHASAIMVLTPQGKIARYFFGIKFDDNNSRDLRFGLIEASHNRIGKAVDQALLLFCFTYDPVTGKYRMMALNLVRLGGVVTVVILGTCLILAWRRERRKPQQQPTVAG